MFRQITIIVRAIIYVNACASIKKVNCSSYMTKMSQQTIPFVKGWCECIKENKNREWHSEVLIILCGCVIR